MLWHATFCINSLAHVVGRQRYVTGDQSRNNWLLALLTMGEGWHNNHHAYQASVRQGFRWWEYDPTYYVLRVLSWFGIVWDLHIPPKAVIRGEHRLGTAGHRQGRLPARRVVPDQSDREPGARRVGAYAGWAELKARISSARTQAETFWSEIDLPVGAHPGRGSPLCQGAARPDAVAGGDRRACPGETAGAGVFATQRSRGVAGKPVSHVTSPGFAD